VALVIIAVKRGVNEMPWAASAFSRGFHALWKSSAAREWIRWRGRRLRFCCDLGGHDAVAFLQPFNNFGHNAVADSCFDLHG
jgi:hypothetical protein